MADAVRRAGRGRSKCSSAAAARARRPPRGCCCASPTAEHVRVLACCALLRANSGAPTRDEGTAACSSGLVEVERLLARRERREHAAANRRHSLLGGEPSALLFLIIVVISGMSKGRLHNCGAVGSVGVGRSARQRPSDAPLATRARGALADNKTRDRHHAGGLNPLPVAHLTATKRSSSLVSAVVGSIAVARRCYFDAAAAAAGASGGGFSLQLLFQFSGAAAARRRATTDDHCIAFLDPQTTLMQMSPRRANVPSGGGQRRSIAHDRKQQPSPLARCL